MLAGTTVGRAGILNVGFQHLCPETCLSGNDPMADIRSFRVTPESRHYTNDRKRRELGRKWTVRFWVKISKSCRNARDPMAVIHIMSVTPRVQIFVRVIGECAKWGGSKPPGLGVHNLLGRSWALSQLRLLWQRCPVGKCADRTTFIKT